MVREPAPFDSTSVDREIDDFPYLDFIVRPEPIGFVEDRGRAIILDQDPSKRVFWLDFVHIDQGISILQLTGWC